ncbi:MAG: hypothetical protein J6L99_06290 [Ruminococcus sp.]|nr:hypothetical protein [Ruminococcus sp.]
MNFRFRMVVLLLFVGIALTVLGFQRSSMLIKGDTVNLSAPVSDFNKSALCEGTIDFVYGPFAVLETTNKTAGVKTGSTTTNFYIVGDTFNGDALVVFTTSDDMLIRKLDDAADKWYEYLTDESIAEGDYPEIAIDFKGYLAKQAKDDDFDTYYQEAIDDLGAIGYVPEDFAEYRIIYGEVGKGSFVMLAGGLLVLALGILMAIKTVKSTKKYLADAKAVTAAEKARKEEMLETADQYAADNIDETSKVVDESDYDTIES